MIKREDILDAMGHLDGELVTETDILRRTRSQNTAWKTWAALAACLVLVIGAAVLLPRWLPMGQSTESAVLEDAAESEEAAAEEAATDDSTVETVAYGVTLDGSVWYYPISFEDRLRYGLVPADATGLTEENTYQITEADLGAAMGTITESGDGNLIGCAVYHFAQYPDNDAICIVDLGYGYAFYTADGLALDDGVGLSSDRILDAYGMPESVTQIEVQDNQCQTLLVIEDADTIAQICAMLGGKENIGLTGNEQRYAQLWLDTYGTDDVTYDGEGMSYATQEAYDLAHALWGEGQRVVCFETTQGFRFYALYCPAIQTFECYGYYVMMPDEVTQMNQLLGSE